MCKKMYDYGDPIYLLPTVLKSSPRYQSIYSLKISLQQLNTDWFYLQRNDKSRSSLIPLFIVKSKNGKIILV